MKDKQRIVIVCGCGRNFTDRHKEYLKRVHDFTVNDRLTKSIIACDGSFWENTSNFKPEDAIMMRYLIDLRTGQFLINRPRVFVEFESRTICKNIRNARRMIQKWPEDSHSNYSIVIFCDVLHALEAKLATIKYFPNHSVEIETYDISRGKNVHSRVFAALFALFRVAWIS